MKLDPAIEQLGKAPTLISLLLVFSKTLDEQGREVWVNNGTYWKLREQPGFANTKNLDLW